MSNPFRIVGDEILYQDFPVARFLPNAVLGRRESAREDLENYVDRDDFVDVKEHDREIQDLQEEIADLEEKLGALEDQLADKEAEAEREFEAAEQARADLAKHLSGELMEAMAAYRAEIAEQAEQITTLRASLRTALGPQPIKRRRKRS